MTRNALRLCAITLAMVPRLCWSRRGRKLAEQNPRFARRYEPRYVDCDCGNLSTGSKTICLVIAVFFLIELIPNRSVAHLKIRFID
jgi:hypothetical protein